MFVDTLEDLNDEQRVRGDDGATGLADDVGHGDTGLGADVADIGDHVAGVFLHRVVHGALKVRPGAIVVDAETAADVEVAHGEAHFVELAIEAGRFDDGVLDRDDVRHLGADVEVHEAQAGLEFGGAELFAGEENFGGVEAELRVVAGGHRPLALAAGEQFGAEADHGLHADRLGNLDDVVDLGELLDDDDDLFAQFATEQGQADVVVVLVAVTNDEALGALVHGESDHELGLRAGFETVVEVLAGGDDLVDDLAELVDLNGEDSAVAAFVGLLLDGFGEAGVDLDHAMPEKILETDHQRSFEAHADSLINDVEDADAAAIGEGLDVNEAGVVNRDVAGAPPLETVVFFGLGDGPGGGRFVFQRRARETGELWLAFKRVDLVR